MKPTTAGRGKERASCAVIPVTPGISVLGSGPTLVVAEVSLVPFAVALILEESAPWR